MGVVDRSFDNPLPTEERAVSPLAGGIMMQGYQCGMLWGAALAAGARAHQLYGAGAHAEAAAISATQELVYAFQSISKGEINCQEITEVNFSASNQMLPILKFFFKGGPIICFGTSAKYAKVAADGIETLDGHEADESIAPPVSCAALTASAMDASELRTTLASGFAGGIGLSGGACGAYGAAIWLTAIRYIESGHEEDLFTSKAFQALVSEITDRFVESSDYEFECEKITGRRFANVQEHAEFIREGGCAKIIETLGKV